ncbi:hypothetical protein Ava_D0019 [Trichormus variabilis ATCC 29413]|uniref:Uncharacterized protein n=2 Tax=Anabaena variabilis TaxID=264691 RepID=Q3M2V2_TRIV2|nr:hypothetical protein [Trichormus variabilis]ABA24684.1 hypothetical protein Ava_D0019 [Trichormus variabilis ATCC 29413]MBC1217721.1 hypothetical protein [Trichormus variabilis ARAD]MBC1258988.1 hypothetical protein [Trichormus variabilis V5]MBC1302699.1 hypothetical protein [Trichormus variabilis N2B]MBC1324554.1 hypothetical protein [Trichormus variabilis 9RC]
MSEELAKKAYRAYGQTTDFKNYQGLSMPDWENLPETIQKAWTSAAVAVTSPEEKPQDLKEKWYCFDMYPEDIDPRFVYWLLKNGIEIRLNGLGKRGVIANLRSHLPERCCTQFFADEMEPAHIFPGLGEILDVTSALDKHDETLGKPERRYRNPLTEDFGRINHKNIADHLLDEIEKISVRQHRLKGFLMMYRMSFNPGEIFPISYNVDTEEGNEDDE